jgi:DNA polymerase I
VRLTKSPSEYSATRAQRQELPYEAMLANGREHWSVGERVYVYRRTQARPGLWIEVEPGAETDADELATAPRQDVRDYDVEHYVRQLQNNFASRLARGLTPEDFEAIIADPDRPSLFQRSLCTAQPILSILQQP